jgi:hypothetical protein
VNFRQMNHEEDINSQIEQIQQCLLTQQNTIDMMLSSFSQYAATAASNA